MKKATFTEGDVFHTSSLIVHTLSLIFPKSDIGRLCQKLCLKILRSSTESVRLRRSKTRSIV